MNDPPVAFADAQLRQLTGNAPAHRSGDWRFVERILLGYLASLRVHVTDAAGQPYVEIVRYKELEETITAPLSIEALAKHLDAELRR